MYHWEMGRRTADLSPQELERLVDETELDEATAIEVLRHPYCTSQIAGRIADSRHLLVSHTIRQLLVGIRDFPFSRAMDLLATLPWTSLLQLAQTPRTPPVIQRHAEKKLLQRLAKLSLGEKIALARRCHRPLFKPLIGDQDRAILEALLDNPRMVENDILFMISRSEKTPELYATIARHRRWGQYYGIRKALAEARACPLPIALSALVQLRRSDLSQLCKRRDVRDAVRRAAIELIEREKQGQRGVVRSSGDGSISGCADQPQGLR
jgi:hypothetical protein